MPAAKKPTTSTRKPSAKKQEFSDGLESLTRSLSNQRKATATNTITSAKLSYPERNEIYKTGLGNKIARIKAESALKEGFVFERDEAEDYYDKYLTNKIIDAAKFMVAMGRSVIVIVEKDQDDQSQPLSDNLDRNNIVLHMFDGSMVTVGDIDRDLTSERYYRPVHYTIRGQNFHHSRVIDFTYVKPIETDLPTYQYGGISEYDLIHDQLISDGVIERAAPTVLDKSSIPVYKIKGFKSALQNKQESKLLDYFATLEAARSIAGAVLLDAEDDAVTLNQALTNLSETDQIGLRRLAMVTGIPLAILVGENVKGLNSTGENEMDTFFMMVESLQNTYLYRPINELMTKLGLGEVEFKQPEQMTPQEKADLDGKYLDNAQKIAALGGDPTSYLEQFDISITSDFSADFPEVEEDADQPI